MKHIPVYFPMTYLPAAGLKRLASCFGRTRMYRPADTPLPEAMQAAAHLGRLEIETPALSEPDNLDSLLEAHYAWAAENKGVDLAAIKGRKTGVPFFGDTTVSGIRQNIREMDFRGGSAETPDPLLAARLFLAMAQELDRQDNDLEKSLDEVRAKEDSMLVDLLGDAERHREVAAAMQGALEADPGAYMTGSRLKAWGLLARAGKGPGNLLVTDSRAVRDYLVERCPGLQKTDPELVLPLPQSGAAGPADWQSQLMQYLADLMSSSAVASPPAEMPAVETEGAVVHLSIYRRAGMDATAFFKSLDDTGRADAAPVGEDNLVICLIVTAGDQEQ